MHENALEQSDHYTEEETACEKETK